MKTFIHGDFLLDNKTSRRLYHTYAEKLPVLDFHCHLSPEMISSDRQFQNLTQGWLEGDHYKWRAMRINGIEEKYCTGNASDKEKFQKWAQTVPDTIGNPLYHWTHLELARYFNIYDLLSPSTAMKIYDDTSSLLQTNDFSCRSLIRKMNVSKICTTDDPTDSLVHHKNLKNDFEIPVLPTWRPDNVIKTDDHQKFTAYIKKLAEASGIEIKNFESLISALENRHDFFHNSGCRLSDHGLDRFYYAVYTQSEADKIFIKLINSEVLSADETEKYRCSVMTELCRMNHKRNWVQQFHVGALRNNNSRMFRIMGPDTGWDSIGNPQDAIKISGFLNSLDDDNRLARTILYNLNPADNEMFATMTGNFNDGSSAGKVQYGAAWWFLDQKYGMEKHLKDISSLGLLKRFIGMVTDSRSFLSYPRHEYFRRILCNYLGNDVEKGIIPDDEELLGPMIEGISYRNAEDFFDFDESVIHI